MTHENHDIQILASISKSFLRTQPCSPMHKSFLAAFTLKHQSEIIVLDTEWSIKPKIFTNWSFTESLPTHDFKENILYS